MHKTLEGTVVSIGMAKTVVIEVIRRMPHPLYRKLLKRSHRFKADSAGKILAIGDVVRITETRPLARGKFFLVSDVITAFNEKRATKEEERA